MWFHAACIGRQGGIGCWVWGKGEFREAGVWVVGLWVCGSVVCGCVGMWDTIGTSLLAVILGSIHSHKS